MISHYLDSKKQEVNGFNRFSKFIVVGNGFDGMIDITFLEYHNWDELKIDFPSKFRKLYCWGEWDLKIYQVPQNYKLVEKHKDYRVPNKGKEIAEFSYMEVGEKLDLLISNNIIHFISETIEVREEIDHNCEELVVITEIFEKYKTILLFEDLDNKDFTDKNYPGNAATFNSKLYEDLN